MSDRRCAETTKLLLHRSSIGCLVLGVKSRLLLFRAQTSNAFDSSYIKGKYLRRFQKEPDHAPKLACCPDPGCCHRGDYLCRPACRFSRRGSENGRNGQSALLAKSAH